MGENDPTGIEQAAAVAQIVGEFQSVLQAGPDRVTIELDLISSRINNAEEVRLNDMAGTETAQYQSEMDLVFRDYVFSQQAIRENILTSGNADAQAILNRISLDTPTPKQAAYLFPIVRQLVNAGPGDDLKDILTTADSAFVENAETPTPSAKAASSRLRTAVISSGVIAPDQIGELFTLKETADPQTDKKGGRGNQTREERNTEMHEAMKRFNQLVKEIGKRREAAEIEDPTTGVPKISEELSSIGLSIDSSLHTSPAQVQAVLEKLGYTDDEINEFIQLRNYTDAVRGSEQMRLQDKELSTRQLEAEEDFSIEKLIQDGILERKNGKLLFSTDIKKRREFQKLIEQYMYYFFSRIDKDPSTPYGEQYDSFTHGQYLSSIKGYIGVLRNEIALHVDATKESDAPSRASIDYIQKMQSYTGDIQKFAQMFHDVPILSKDPSSIDRWGGMFASLPPAKVAKFQENPVVRMASAIAERHILKRQVLNGGRFPSDLFDVINDESTGTLSNPDRDSMREELRRTLTELGMEVEEWEINRALSYGMGIGYITLRLPAVMGSADPEGVEYKGIQDLMALLWNKWGWGKQRGMPAHDSLVPEITLGFKLKYNEEARLLGAKIASRFKGEWNPKKLHEEVKKGLHALGAKLDFTLLDQMGSYGQLTEIFNIGDMFTRHGWRTEHIMGSGKAGDRGIPEIADRLEALGIKWSDKDKWSKQQWDETFKIITEEIGSGALWFYTKIRALSEAKHTHKALQDHLHHHGGKHLHEFHEYNTGEEMNEELYEVEVYDKNGEKQERKITMSRFLQYKEYEVNGEFFRHLLRRSPGDFLLNVMQIAPEMHDISNKNIWKVVNGKRRLMDVGDLDPKDDDFEKKRRQLNYIRNRWGVEGTREIEWITQWTDTVVAEYSRYPDRVPGLSELLAKPNRTTHDEIQIRNKVLGYVTSQYGVALERLRAFNENGSAQKLLKMDKSHINDAILSNLTFGDNGLMTHIDGLNEMSGEFNKIGTQGLFYSLGRAWTHKFGDYHPNTNDMNMYLIYRDASKAGDTMFKRLVGDVHSWNEVTKELSQLDMVLTQLGSSGNLEKVMELHGKIFGLKGIIGIHKAQKANSILAQMVIQYMAEADIAHLPLLPGTEIIARLDLTKNISLSKIYGGYEAHSMDPNAIKGYIHDLEHARFIGEEGKWSYQHLADMAGVSQDIFFAEVIPQAMLYMILLVLYAYIQKAMEMDMNPAGGGGGGGGGGHGHGGHH